MFNPDILNFTKFQLSIHFLPVRKKYFFQPEFPKSIVAKTIEYKSPNTLNLGLTFKKTFFHLAKSQVLADRWCKTDKKIIAEEKFLGYQIFDYEGFSWEKLTFRLLSVLARKSFVTYSSQMLCNALNLLILLMLDDYALRSLRLCLTFGGPFRF